jgi:uncharacterized protein YgbK (DUF1537 family)
VDTDVVAAVVPYVAAAAGAYGTAVLEKVRDQAVDATAGLGRQLLRRIFGEPLPAPVEAAVVDLAGDPSDPDRVATIRRQIRIALEADPALAADVARMVRGAEIHIEALGDRSVAVQRNSGIIQTGDRAQAAQHRP